MAILYVYVVWHTHTSEEHFLYYEKFLDQPEIEFVTLSTVMLRFYSL